MNIGSILLITSMATALASVICRTVSFNDIKASGWSVALAYISAGLSSCAVLLMVYYLVSCDFSFGYAAAHTSLSLPVPYRISALWAGQEGSVLLWAVTALWIRPFCFKDNKADLVYSIICVCLLALTAASNPFARLPLPPADGQGINEALQDPWMIVHPPLVFIGYSCMGMLFAKGFSNASKDWVLASLLFLGLGIISGSIWAYRALSWGGYWAWDPIENAALIPWLILCALLHRKSIPGPMAALPFILAVVCTYLARSGVLQQASVHSYAKSYMGPLLLALLSAAIASFAALIVFGRRKEQFDYDNKNKLLIAVLEVSLYVFSVLILAGTLWPVFTGRSAGLPYYSSCSAALLTICAAAITAYRYPHLVKGGSLYTSFIAGTLLTLGCAFITSFWQPLWLILLWAAFTAAIIEVFSIWHIKSIWQSLSHTGFFIMSAGVITSSVMGVKGILMDPLDYTGTAIIHKFSGDIIITDGFSYLTKPLIWLFWLGTLLLLIGISGCFIKKYIAEDMKEPC